MQPTQRDDATLSIRPASRLFSPTCSSSTQMLTLARRARSGPNVVPNAKQPVANRVALTLKEMA